MQPRQTLHAGKVLQHPVDRAIAAAIRIADEDAAVPSSWAAWAVCVACARELGAQAGRDLGRAQVQLGVQATDVQVVPAVGAPNRVQLSAERAASDHQNGVARHPQRHLARIASACRRPVPGVTHRL